MDNPVRVAISEVLGQLVQLEILDSLEVKELVVQRASLGDLVQPVPLDLLDLKAYRVPRALQDYKGREVIQDQLVKLASQV